MIVFKTISPLPLSTLPPSSDELTLTLTAVGTLSEPEEECTLVCPNGYKLDEFGKQMCDCADPTSGGIHHPLCPPLTRCKKNCVYGFKVSRILVIGWWCPLGVWYGYSIDSGAPECAAGLINRQWRPLGVW